MPTLQTKYPQLALDLAFNRVADKTHWKNPIDAVISLGWDQPESLDLVREAVIHFTGSVPTFTRIGDVGGAGDVKYRVQAIGYYAAIGA